MMKKENLLSELTAEDLNKMKNSVSKTVYATMIVVLVLSGVLLYLIAKSKNMALFGVIPACLLMMLPGIIKLSKINAEIKSRDPKKG